MAFKIRKDITGKKFGRLTILGIGTKPNYWVCKCECGKEKEIRKNNFAGDNSKTVSCGCYAAELLKKIKRRQPIHGMVRTRPYTIWSGMKSRCKNQRGAKGWEYYGGKGVSVCERWQEFKNFWEDMKDGYAENLSVDRIDNNKGYCKENCRWADFKTQSRNKTGSQVFAGVNSIDASPKLNGNKSLVTKRLLRGWTKEKAFTTLARKYNKKYAK